MQHRTALQSSMGIGEKPSQGAMFPEFHGEGFKEPITKPVSKPKPAPMFEETYNDKLGRIIFGDAWDTDSHTDEA